MITARIDATAHIPAASLCEAPPLPRSIKIELSPRCNYRCTYCGLSARAEQPTRDMDFALFQRITAEMAAAGVAEIGLFYIGESFVNPTLLVNAIRHVKSLGIPYVFLTSNGSLARPAVVRDCMAAGLDSLKWSVNFADTVQFEAMARVKARCYDGALANIRAAWALRETEGFATRLYASSIRHTDAQHEAMQALLRAHVLPYVDEHYWLPLMNHGLIFTGKGVVRSAGNTARYDNPVSPLPCWALFTVGHVLADGRFSCCCWDATGQWVMGDLRTQTLTEIWTGAPFRALRAAHLAKDVTGTVCEQCVSMA